MLNSMGNAVRKRGPEQPAEGRWHRILNAARIGLAMVGGETDGDGPASDRQLAMKIGECHLRIMEEEHGMEDTEETAADAEAKNGNERDYCYYPECTEWARRDGLCMKHLVALSRGDEKAVKIVRAFHRVEEQAKPTSPPSAASDAGDRTDHNQKEQAMGEQVKCEKCQRTFDKQGIGPHRARCKGPVAAVVQCGHEGCARPVGHSGKHMRRRGAAPVFAPTKRKCVRREELEPQRAAAPTVNGGGITIAADAPAAIVNRARQLAEALGMVELHGANPDSITLMNSVNGRCAVIGFDGTIRRGVMTFQEITAGA